MIIVNINGSVEHALKQYKNKHNKIGIIKELRDRKTFIKPSVKRRTEILKARYVESKKIK